MQVVKRGLTTLAATATAMVAFGGVAAIATPAAAAPSTATTANPYSPSYQHSYRHGAIPTLQRKSMMDKWNATHAAQAATGPETLSYAGGTNGVGVDDGKDQVYLVFYGNQWGTQSTNGNGDLTFSGDSNGGAPVAQEMFKDIGTGNELWSADLTQWCDGAGVASGATSCPSNASFIPYQSGGVLAGVWYDNSAASPAAATGNQLGQEAVNAAKHFGNTASGANRHTYYVILSPHGTNPDSYQGQYCAWHDYTGDSTLSGGAVSSPYGDLAFSNQPYNFDSGAGCGVDFINSTGSLDGWTMTLGHEWHEMMSDMFPMGGWSNHTGSSYNGQENSDECAWIKSGQPGGAANVTMGTGTFAEQASWSNDTNACAISHPIVNHGGTGSVSVANPGNQTGTVGKAASLQLSASGGSAPYTFSATGLPAGLSINSAGLVSGTPSAAGTSSVTVTAKDSTGATGSTTFSWTITSVTGGSVTVANPGDQEDWEWFDITPVQISATASDGGSLTYAATGLPDGLSIDSSTGSISGAPLTPGTYSVKVTATEASGATGSTTFTWTIDSWF
ncbi:MAG TPA: Ig domain-containing protein [Pseudonocardiaceae bacterium]|nr:Ig domain-containing protein [Pseudonocardiaceae bacterium]